MNLGWKVRGFPPHKNMAWLRRVCLPRCGYIRGGRHQGNPGTRVLGWEVGIVLPGKEKKAKKEENANGVAYGTGPAKADLHSKGIMCWKVIPGDSVVCYYICFVSGTGRHFGRETTYGVPFPTPGTGLLQQAAYRWLKLPAFFVYRCKPAAHRCCTVECLPSHNCWLLCPDVEVAGRGHSRHLQAQAAARHCLFHSLNKPCLSLVMLLRCGGGQARVCTPSLGASRSATPLPVTQLE